MRFPLSPALLLPAALLAGCDGNAGKSNVNDTVLADNGLATEPNGSIPVENETAVVITGQAFANTIAASDAFEIAAAKLAETKATVQDLKDFAAMMIRDHTASTDKLKAAAAVANPAITPDPTYTDEQKANLQTLKDATGAEFDTAYKSQQVTAHQSALAALQAYGASGEVQSLREFAAAVTPTVQEHFDRIKRL